MSYMKEWKEYYRLSPRDLSQDSIKTLRWTSLVGLVSGISGLLMIWGLLPVNIVTGCGLALGLIFGFIALLHRLPNFLSITDKHLDEWSRVAKKNAESFTYRVMLYSMFATMLLGFALLSSDITGLRLVLSPSLEQIGFSLFLLPIVFQLITTSHLAWKIKPMSDEDVREMNEIEAPRKSGKWMVILTVAILVLGSLGGRALDYKYKTIADDTSKTCVITMETEVPMAQLKHLHDCETLKKNN